MIVVVADIVVCERAMCVGGIEFPRRTDGEGRQCRFLNFWIVSASQKRSTNFGPDSLAFHHLTSLDRFLICFKFL